MRRDHQITQIEMVTRLLLLFWIPKKPPNTTRTKSSIAGSWSRNRVLRFLKETPVIVGADMKTYGPFQPEDVASVPAENAKVLTRQGIAVEVEVQLEPR